MRSRWSDVVVLLCIILGLFKEADCTPTSLFDKPFSLNIPNRSEYSGCKIYVYGEQGGNHVYLNQNSQYTTVTAASGPPQPEPVFGHLQGAPIFLPPGELAGARIYIVCGGDMTFSKVIDANGNSRLQPGPTIDMEYNYIEFTINNNRMLFVNISMVDMLANPALGYKIESGHTGQQVYGPRPNAVTSACNDLKAQSQVDGMPWGELCQESNGKLMRVLSPGEYMKSNPDAFDGYFTAYAKQVYTQWATQPKLFNLGNNGKITCVGSADGLSANCDGRVYGIPTSGDVFGCASGPFAAVGQGSLHEVLRAPLCAAFNRGTALSETNPSPVRNWYVDEVHEYTWVNIGYAFAFDDVAIDGQTQDGTLASDKAKGLTINIGGTWPTS